jgi:hypothetical protein
MILWRTRPDLPISSARTSGPSCKQYRQGRPLLHQQAMVSSAAMEQAIRALEQVYQVTLIHVGEGNEANVELAAILPS